MNTLTCSQIDQRLELYLSGILDSEECLAVEDHLATCPVCSASLARARQLAGLLDLHYQMPDRLARLQQRLRQEPVVRRSSGKGMVRQFASLAALLLVTLGLSGLLMPAHPNVVSELQLTASLNPAKSSREMNNPPAVALDPAIRRAFRLTDLDLGLSITNTSPRPVRLDVAHGVLQFTLINPARHVVRGTLEAKSALGPAEGVLLQPGARFALHLRQFVEPGAHENLSQSGDYTLSLRYTVGWREQDTGVLRKQTLETRPVRFPVPGAPP